jgi:hypothetical protein
MKRKATDEKWKEKHDRKIRIGILVAYIGLRCIWDLSGKLRDERNEDIGFPGQ